MGWRFGGHFSVSQGVDVGAEGIELVVANPPTFRCRFDNHLGGMDSGGQVAVGGAHCIQHKSLDGVSNRFKHDVSLLRLS